MEIHLNRSTIANTKADALVIGLFADAALAGAALQFDQAANGIVSRLRESREFSGKRNEVISLIAPAGVQAERVALVGLGNRDKFDVGAAYRSAASAARSLSTKARPVIAYFFDGCDTPALVESAVAGAMVGCEGQDLYRTEKNRFPFESLLWSEGDTGALASGKIIGESINVARRLVNEPAQEIYPETFANRAVEIARECGLEAEIWDQSRLESERCGALLAVNKGSSRPARLVILRRRGAASDAPTLAIVGKGVTFDSGGLSLKPTEGMLTMKCDMAGAATMLGAMRAIGLLKLPINVIGLCGLVENMTGPAAMKLGDVLHARNGKTIEVQNTDAEGRLVLADVLSVAVDQGATKIVDLATLTGACVVALGTEVAGAMTNDQPWLDAVLAAARSCGEPIWQLPMDAEIFDEIIKSEIADMKNTGDGRWGGAIAAAKFLEQFVAQRPWTHLDIAGPAYRDKPKPWAEAGGSGQYVRTLVELARHWPA